MGNSTIYSAERHTLLSSSSATGRYAVTQQCQPGELVPYDLRKHREIKTSVELSHIPLP